jgi:cell division protein FtsB
MRILCAIPDLLLKHLDTTLATYKRRQMKYLKHTSKTLEKHIKTLENHCKHMQYLDKTLSTYA